MSLPADDELRDEYDFTAEDLRPGERGRYAGQPGGAHRVEVEVEVAGAQLPELVERAAQGHEVIVTREGEPVARIVPVSRAREIRRFGSARGLIHMTDDFDAPLDDFKDDM